MTFYKTYPKFKVGDVVELVGIYRRDKAFNQVKGRVLEHFIDPENAKIGGSIDIYVVDGVGTYGEGALKKST